MNPVIEIEEGFIFDFAEDPNSAVLTNSEISPLISEVGRELAWLTVAGADAVTQGTEQAPLFVNTELLQVVGDNVAIEAAGEDAEALLVDLEALGLEAGVAFGNLVSGLIPIEAIDEIANLDSLEFARPAYKSITNVGSTTSQADVAMNSDDARTNFGIDGTGITVGVLSDSYDTSTSATTNASEDIASGDLPAGVNVLQDGTSPSTNIDEGRAMLQLIHDVAPGADLAFHTAFGGQSVFAQGILDLAAAGAEVIVDDVINLGEPMFQDGIVAQAVDQVVASGVSYFSSAGNNARQSYESAFDGSGIINGFNFGEGLIKFYEWHDFSGAGDIFQAITVPVGATAQFSFQWDQPFFSASGVSGSTSDIDIFLTNGEIVTNLVAGSIVSNIGGDAVEVFSFTNNDPSETGNTSFNILIGNAGGPDPGLMKYVEFGGITLDEYDPLSPTSFGHANAAGASSVGAAAYFNTPEFNMASPVLNSFSSAGGIDILFDTAGNRLVTPESRQNVDIVAPDGTNTTFFGQQINDGDSFPNFFGTSAAAPHAAAVAALMLESAGGAGSLTPSEIYSALETTAIDILETTASDILSPGYDADSGFGLIDANAAVAAVTPPTIEFSQATYSVSEGDGTTNLVTLTRSSTTGTSEVQVSITGGTATGGTDYNNGSFPLNVVFSDGESSKTVAVPIFEDTIYEPTAETIDFSVTTVSNAEIGTQSTTTLNINDNDSQPTVSLSLSDSPLAENGGVATVTATLSNESTEDVTVNLGFSGTATGSGTDYTASDSSITITAGNTTGSITLTGNDDAIAEADETIIVDIDSVTNGTEDGVQQVTATITEDDIPTIGIEDVTVTEGNDAIFTVSLSTASTQTITVDYGTANDTATAGSDYTANSGSLTFNPDETSQTITVQGLDDTDVEGDERFFVNLSNSTNATIADNQGIGTIAEDDVPTISIDDVTVTEGNDAIFTVSLSTASTETITVDYGTADDTATAGSDYTANSGSLTFNPGETSQTITVQGLDDTDVEGDEQFFVNLSNSTNATIADNQGIGTIAEDDVPTISIDDVTVTEGNDAIFTVSLSTASTQTITVDYGTADDTATAGSDYTAGSGSLTFDPDETSQTITVQGLGDTDFEGAEQFFVNLSNPSNATIADNQGIGSITDDDFNITSQPDNWELQGTEDFDGDGKADLLWRDPSTGDNQLWLMDGETVVSSNDLNPAHPNWKIKGVNDFNGDNKADILLRNSVTGANSMWLYDGATRIESGNINRAVLDWDVADTNDFNGDGNADILLRNSVTGENSMWLFNGRTRIESGNINRATVDWEVADTNDFNGDGNSDILLRNSIGQNSLWTMDGRTRIGSGNINGASPEWKVADTNDFNGDGNADILLRNSVTGENVLWMMDERTRLDISNLSSAAIRWEVGGTGDFDGDGDTDIFWRDPLTGENALWLMDGVTYPGGDLL